MLHTARRAKALGYGYQARLRGLELCGIQLTSTRLRHLPPLSLGFLDDRGSYWSDVCATPL
jgi:hypothetical protein